MLSSSGALCRSWTVVGTAPRVGTSQRVHRAINQQHSRQPRFQTTPPLLAFTRRERLVVQRRATVHCAAEASAELTSPVEGPPSSKQGAFTQARAAMNGVMKRAGSTKQRTSNETQGKKSKKGGKVGGIRAGILIPLLDNSEQEVQEMVTEVLRDVTTNTVVYLGDAAYVDAFSAGSNVTARALDDVGSMEMISLDVGLVLVVGPTPDQMTALRTLSQRAGQCPMLLLNAEWDPDNVPAGQRALVDSFEVVYWHQPLSIEGLMKNTAGAVYKFAPSGVPADESWYVFWNDKQVFSNPTRPTALQLEQVLYQKAAEDSKLVQAAKVAAAAKEKLFGGFGKKNK